MTCLKAAMHTLPSMTSPRLRGATLALALLAAGCEEPQDAKHLVGYVEADLVYLSSQEGGAIAEIMVKEGDAVDEGGVVFRLNPSKASIAIDEASAQAAAHIDAAGALAKAVAEAEAQHDIARRTYERSRSLWGQGYATDQRADSDRAALEAARARLARVRAERDQAANQSEAMKAAVALWRQRLEDMTVTAPSKGVIERLYRRRGEVVGAGDPVAALRPVGAIKIRFYAPQPVLSSISTGAQIAFSCDGCPPDLAARITFISGTPQFTPPVIYSLKERAKLVFLVEAAPIAADLTLASGLPVDIVLP